MSLLSSVRMTEKAGVCVVLTELLLRLGLQAQVGLSASDGSQKEQVQPSAWGPWREGVLLHMVRKEEALPHCLPWGFWYPGDSEL